jgi:hemerythrin-like domain-containing protein
MRKEPSERTATHPLDALIAEHRVIERVLEAIEREAARRGPLRAVFWQDAARFLVEFADRRHHGKEEDVLFPALEASGLPRDHGPTAVMRAEHDEGRGLVALLRSALAEESSTAVFAAARAFAGLLRQHIEKEDAVLFELARGLLSDEQVARLGSDFRRADLAFDREHGAGTFERLAHELGTDRSSQE